MKKRKWKNLFAVIGILFLTGACREKAEQEWFRSFKDPSRQLTSTQVDSITRSARDLPVREKCSLLLDAEMRCIDSAPRREKRLKDILAYAPDDTRRRVKLQLFEVYTANINIVSTSYSARDSAALLLLELEREKHFTVEEQGYFLIKKSSFFELSGDLDEALSVALQGLELQRKLGNKEREQSYLLRLALMQARARNYEASVHYCQRLLADGPSLPDYYKFHIHTTLTKAYKELGRWDEAIEACLRTKEVAKILPRNAMSENGINRLLAELYINKGNGAEARRWLNARSNNILFYSHVARSYDCEGKADSAARAREQFFRALKEESERSITRSNISPFIPDYLTYANWLWNNKRRTEALELLSKTIKLPESRNSISFWGDTYIALLEQYYTYCVALNREEEAIAGLIRLNGFRKRLSEDQEVSRAKESAARAFSKELVSQINRQKQAILRRERWVWTAGITTVILATLAAGGWVMYRQKKRMLDALYLKQKALERMVYSTNTRQEAGERNELSREEQLFYKINALMKKDKLFVNPNLTLDDIALLVGTNRSYTSAAVNVCTGMNFSQWISKLRVEYFISQLSGNEDHIEELFQESGFFSSSSFYRSFKIHTGLTPKQYIAREKKNTTTPAGRMP